MAYDIRSLSMAEILDTAFQLLRDHFPLLAGISLLSQTPTIAFFGAYDFLLDPFARADPELAADLVTPALLSAVGAYVLAIFALLPFATAAMTAAIGQIYLGARVTWGRVARTALSHYLPIVWTYLILTVAGTAVMVLAVGLLVGLFMGGASVLQPLGGFGVLVGVLFVVAVVVGFIAVGFLYFAGFFVLAAVVVLEGRKGVEAISRAWSLLVAQPLRTLGVAVTIYLIALIPPAGIQMLVGVIPMVGVFVWGAVQAVAYAFAFAATVVLYFDIRCRLEAFDLEHLARTVQGREPSAAEAAV